MTKQKKHPASPMSLKTRRLGTPQSTQTNRMSSSRKRIRASQFAVRSSTKRRASNTRRQLQTDLDAEAQTPVYDDADVDKVLNDVRELMRSGSARETEGGAQLLEALQKADEEFRRDTSETSSTDEECSKSSKRPKRVDSKAVSGPERSNETLDSKNLNTTNKLENGSSSASKFTRKKHTSKLRPAEPDGNDITKSIRDHQRDIEALKKDDPEFYKFLEENDASLLELDDVIDPDIEKHGSPSDSSSSEIQMMNENEPSLANRQLSVEKAGDEEEGDVEEEDVEEEDVEEGDDDDGSDEDGDDEDGDDEDGDDEDGNDEDGNDEDGNEDDGNVIPRNDIGCSNGLKGDTSKSRNVRLSHNSFDAKEDDVNSKNSSELVLEDIADGNVNNEENIAVSKRHEYEQGFSKSDANKLRSSAVEKHSESIRKKVNKERKTKAFNEADDLVVSAAPAEISHGPPELQAEKCVTRKIRSPKGRKVSEAPGSNDSGGVGLSLKGQHARQNNQEGTTMAETTQSDSAVDSIEIADEHKEGNFVNSSSLLDEPALKSLNDKLEDDKTGYSSEEEDDAVAELEAAAEANLTDIPNSTSSDELTGALDESEVSDDGEEGSDDPNSEESGLSEDSEDVSLEDDIVPDGTSLVAKDSELIIVDLNFLKELKEKLRGGRSACMDACSKLLTIFKAGLKMVAKLDTMRKGIDKKDQRRAVSSGSADIVGTETEVLENGNLDGGEGFSAGKVKFVSSKAYKQSINLAIIGIQEALERLLGKPATTEDSETVSAKWEPTKSKRWNNLKPIFRRFVPLVVSLCESSTEPTTLRFLLKRIERLAPFTSGEKKYLTKIVRIAVRLWSSDIQSVSHETRLRAYLLLNRFAHIPSNTELVLRSCFHAYHSSVANVCNPKTLPLIHFGTACLTELFGIDMKASYSTAYSYLRELAVTLRSVLVAKDGKTETERVHNWSYVNQIRALSKMLGKHSGEDELRPLIYPLVQIALGVMRLSFAPRSYPLRLHMASYLSEIIRETGIFIPVVPHILQLLRCSELRKQPTHSTVKSLEWRGMLRVSDEVLKTKLYLTGIIDWVVLEIARFFAIVSKHVSFPELAFFAETSLKKAAKEVSLLDWKMKLSSLARKLQETSDIITSARSKADFSPRGAVSPLGMLAAVPGLDPNRKMPVARLFEAEHNKLTKEHLLRDEAAANGTQTSEDAGVSDKTDTGNVSKRSSKRKRGLPKKSSDKAQAASLSKSNTTKDEEDLVQTLTLNSDDSESD